MNSQVLIDGYQVQWHQSKPLEQALDTFLGQELGLLIDVQSSMPIMPWDAPRSKTVTKEDIWKLVLSIGYDTELGVRGIPGTVTDYANGNWFSQVGRQLLGVSMYDLSEDKPKGIGYLVISNLHESEYAKGR